MKRTVLVVLAALSALVSPLLAASGQGQGAQAGQGNPSTPPPKATALIIGEVVDGSTGKPIPEAIVTLTPGRGRGGGLGSMPGGMSPEIQQAMQAAMAAAGTGRGPAGQQRIMTGPDGRFVFHDLAPGTFTLSPTLTGYTSSLAVTATPGLAGMISGVTSAGSPTSLTVKEGEFATGLKLRMWKYAVVSGTVVDDAGEPAIGITVQVARKFMASGRARFVPASSAKTDDRGIYRISSLVPGDYIVVVPQAQMSLPTAIMSGMMESLKSGGMGMGGAAMAMLDLMSSGLNPTDALQGGVRIGDFMVASSGSVPLFSPDGRLLAFQTALYPGASAPAQASVLALKSGEDKADVNFQLRLIPTSRISGVALGPEGPVSNLGIRLVVPADGTMSESEFDVATAVTKADGTFAFFGVPPGQFLLRAQKQPRPAIPASAMGAAGNMFGPEGIPAGAKEMLFAVTTVSVAGDIDNLTLQLTPGLRVSGKFEFESQSGAPPPPAGQITSAVVVLTPVDGRMPNLLGMADPDRANTQGEFKTKGYQPGRYFLTVAGVSSWFLKSATIGGRDVLDAPLEIRDADISGVVVTFTDKMARVTGTVRSAGETDLSETSVVVFPANFRAWADNGMNPRRSQNVRASRNGTYTVANLPAGDYLIAAIDRATVGDLQDPAYLDALSRVATRFTAGVDPVTQDLNKVRVGK